MFTELSLFLSEKAGRNPSQSSLWGKGAFVLGPTPSSSPALPCLSIATVSQNVVAGESFWVWRQIHEVTAELEVWIILKAYF